MFLANIYRGLLGNFEPSKYNFRNLMFLIQLLLVKISFLNIRGGV